MRRFLEARWISRLLPRDAYTAAFCGALLLFAALSIYCDRSTRTLAHETDRRQHAERVIGEIRGLLASVLDVDRSGRGFVLTGNDRSLGPYDSAFRDLPARTIALRRLTEDDPGQQRRLDALVPLLMQEIETISRANSLRRSEGFRAAADWIESPASRQLVDSLRAVLQAMEEDERAVLAERSRTAERAAQSALIALFGAAGFGAAMMLAGFVALQREFRVRMRAQAARKDDEVRLQSILDVMPVAVFIKDVDGRFLHANRRWTSLFGLERAAVVGKTHEDLFPAGVADQFRADDHKVLESGASVHAEEIVAQTDGPRTFRLLKAPVKGAGGQIEALCGVATDITERKEFEETLRASSKAAERARDEARCVHLPAAWSPRQR